MSKKKPGVQPDELVITKSQYDTYLSTDGAYCPKCGSSDIVLYPPEAEELVYVRAKCLDCSATWEEIHTLDGIDDVRIVADKETVVLGCYGIVVTHDGEGGAGISSSLRQGLEPGECEEAELDAAINTLESVILAAARAGIQVKEAMFLEVIETVVSKIEEQYV